MKISGKQSRRKDEASLKSNTSIGISSTRGKTSAKRIGGQQCKSAPEMCGMCHLSGKSEANLVGKDEHLVSSRPANDLLEHGQALQPSVKIKLQLFPIDEHTRLGLEKDGHNQHLELTLKAQNRIHSVVKHLTKKWGSSSNTMGELVLFSYNIQLENLAADKR